MSIFNRQVMAGQFTLGKDERLKSRKQIEQLFNEGKKITVGPFRVFYLFVNTTSIGHSSLSFGVGVSNRNFKKAVDRNKIKRLTREAWRLQKNSLKETVNAKNKHLNIFLIYTSKELPGFELVKDKVAVALKKLEKLADENSVTNS
jgi:ribonuclease P protein component